MLITETDLLRLDTIYQGGPYVRVEASPLSSSELDVVYQGGPYVAFSLVVSLGSFGGTEDGSDSVVASGQVLIQGIVNAVETELDSFLIRGNALIGGGGHAGIKATPRTTQYMRRRDDEDEDEDDATNVILVTIKFGEYKVWSRTYTVDAIEKNISIRAINFVNTTSNNLEVSVDSISPVMKHVSATFSSNDK